MAQKRARNSVMPKISVGHSISVLWEKTDPDTGEKIGHEWYHGKVSAFKEGTKGKLHVWVDYDDGDKRAETFDRKHHGITFKLDDDKPKTLNPKSEEDDEAVSEEENDFWSTLDEGSKKIKLLEDTVLELKTRICALESKVGEVKQQQTVDEGIDPDRFAALPVSERSKYHSGGMTGVVKPIDYSDPESSSYVMCCYYKNMSTPCASKCLKSVKNAAGVMTEKYESPKAEYVPMALLARLDFRKKFHETARQVAVNYSMCSGCRSKVQGDVMPFPHITELCMFCRKTRACRGKLCATCEPKFDVRERGLECVFSILKIFSPDVHFKVNLDAAGKFVDFSISGTYQNKKFLVIIEQDEEQHTKYNQHADNEKFAKQTARMMQIQRKEEEYPLVFMIRFDPDAKCRPTEGMKNLTQLFDKVECRVVLRSWIIWYLMNIREVRKCLIMYLFYDISKRKNLFGSKFEGFGMAYGAPINPPDWNWFYRTDPGEAIPGKKYGNIINKSLEDPDKVFKEWRDVGATKDYPRKLLGQLDALRGSGSF